MNKTIIINISGIIFHIEEDAYELLKVYMNELKKHFNSSEDSFEIITDIENRIAEMFSDILKKENKQVIVTTDVNGVISQMGRASDFSINEDQDELAESYTGPVYRKRLFRNPDDRIIGGVCGGIAAYFNTEAIWIRIAVVILFFAFGFGILLYPLLWIIMPLAQTRTEKLAMRGEQVNISTIHKSVKEEEAKKQTGNSGSDRVLGFIRNLIDYLLRFLGKVFKSLGKIVGVIFILFGALALLGILSGGFALFELIKTDMSTEFPFNVVEPGLQGWLVVSMLFSGFIPLLALFLIGLKLLTNRPAFNKTTGFTLFGLWIIAIGTCSFLITKTATNFREEANFRETDVLKATDKEVYYIRMNDEYQFTRLDTTSLLMKKEVSKKHLYFNESDLVRLRFPRIRIESTENAQPSLIKNFSARGHDFRSAMDATKDISYGYMQKDSSIIFDWVYQVSKDQPYRAQEVDLTLKLPIGSKVIIDNSNYHIEQLLDNVWLYSCADYHEDKVIFEMTKDGLECVNKREEDKEDAENEENDKENLTLTTLRNRSFTVNSGQFDQHLVLLDLIGTYHPDFFDEGITGGFDNIFHFHSF